MSRTQSQAFREAVNASETEQAFLVLLVIDHPDLAEPIRVTSDGVDTVSNGETYKAYPFKIELPAQDEESPPAARVEIDNVDREIIRTVRAITTAPSVTIRVVLGSSPDMVEAEFSEFRLRNVPYDVMTLRGDLTVDHFAKEPYPAGRFTPADFPGLF